MQNIINANQKSKTQEFMVNQGEYVPFFKNPPVVGGTLGKQYQKITPSIDIGVVDPSNKTILLKIPPGAGFWLSSRIKFTYGTGALTAAEIQNLAAVNNLRDMSIEFNGMPIITKTKSAMRSSIRNIKDKAFKEHVYRYSQMLDPITEKVLVAGAGPFTAVSYLPSIESFLTKPERALLLNVLKECYVRFNFDTQSGAGLGAPLTSMTAEMELESYMPKLSLYNQMVQKDWSESMIFQCTNYYSEVFPLTASETATKTMTLNCPFLVSKIYIDLRQNDNTVGAGLSLGLPPTDILSCTLNIGGVQYFSVTKTSWFKYVNSKFGYSNEFVFNDSLVEFDDTGSIVINFGIIGDEFVNSGTAFMQDLRGSTLTITYAGGLVQKSVYVDYEYFQGNQYTPDVGGGNIMVISNN